MQFYPVSEQELDRLREDFREGRAHIRIEEEDFDLAGYDAFLKENETDIAAFRARQKAAFDTEVALWQAEASIDVVAELEEELAIAVAEDGHLVAADISGNVWKLLVEAGHKVEAGDPIVILEAMKMEFPIHAPVSGTVRALHCRPGKAIAAGDALVEIQVEAV